ncbi:hypothetical protein T01_15866 [Trichinella spiralis]|uniref:Uncharacterized protein n=1 Tax=Trichinella spiralis TaxID=6334 RepID=A0A0V1BPY1_TRISP|nr:hypothetical protein T01_15866 [Trichinella spiralis]
MSGYSKGRRTKRFGLLRSSGSSQLSIAAASCSIGVVGSSCLDVSLPFSTLSLSDVYFETSANRIVKILLIDNN